MRVHDDIDRTLSPSDYDDARSTFRTLCAQAGIAESQVSFFGTVGSPGISDIDVLVTGGDAELTTLAQLLQEERKHNAGFGYLFWHDPVFVTDRALAAAPFLHTLDGVTGELADSVRVRNESESYRGLLNVIWYTTLIRAAAEMLWQKHPVSARALLLVYKNLEYSRSYFSHMLGAADDFPGPRSQELRDRIIGRETTVERLGDWFREAIQATNKAFDGYSRVNGAQLGLRPGRARVVARHKIFFTAANSTRIWKFGPLRSIRTNRWAFELMTKQPPAPDSDLMTYRAAVGGASQAYADSAVGYPFLWPFGVPVDPLRQD